MRKLLLLGSFLGLVSMNAQTNVYSYGFDTAFTTWTTSNQSSPVTTSVWTKATYTTPLTNPLFGSGNTTTVPVGQAGGSNSFALVNYTSTSGAGTISNWLFTNAIDVKNGDIVSFYSRKGTDGTTDYPDRLELRYALAAGAVLPTTGAADVGSFTNLGVSVNPTLAGNFVYPKIWTKYSFTVTGVGTTPVPVRFAFRYYVTDGGPSGNNSDLIGIDTFSIDRPTLSTNDVYLSDKEVSVYPNPTTDYISVKSADKFSNIEVFDIAGKKVDVKLEGDKINVKHLNAGSYIISIESKGNKISQKFIKK
ncbi:choice-of-anchor J domain-containing protein [Chryseobacterium sp.]|uniref:choice-of-anchor J domain-containing protein n=1 Tax=Chryseobacterium sp. TaxID=1871047 RepID=UPI0035C76852